MTAYGTLPSTPKSKIARMFGMRERGDRLRLALEAGARPGVGRQRIRKDLDRHVAIELRVARAIHLAHSAGAQRGEDFVQTERSTRRERHQGWGRRYFSNAATFATPAFAQASSCGWLEPELPTPPMISSPI